MRKFNMTENLNVEEETHFIQQQRKVLVASA